MVEFYNMKRRIILYLQGITCLFFIIFANKLSAQQDTVSLLHISDLHVIFNLNSYQQDLVRSREHYGQGIEPLKQFFQVVPKKTKCDMIVATGDLIDFYEGEIPGKKMLGNQVEQFSRLANECPVPLSLTLGNHDIAGYSWKDSILVSSQNKAGEARASWIRNIPCFNNGTYYSKVVKAGETTFRLIFLDDAYNSVLPGENMKLPYIDKAQLHWLQDQLQQSDSDVEIIFMHIPFSSNTESSCELYSVLIKEPSVKLILAGHNHKNAVTVFNSENNHAITQVQTGAFAQVAGSWRLICLTGSNILVSVPGNTESELKIATR